MLLPSHHGASKLTPQPGVAEFPPPQPELPSSLRPLDSETASDHLGLRHALQPRAAELPLFHLGVDEVISPQFGTTELPPGTTVSA